MQLAREAAHSYNHNTDNGETMWYIFWGLVLSYISEGISPDGYCLPAPQYALRIWLPETAPNQPTANQLPNDPEGDSDSEMEDLVEDPDGSMITTASLVESYHKKGPRRSPDFAAVYFHVTASTPIQAPISYLDLFLFRHWRSRIPLIMENKRSPKRLPGPRGLVFMNRLRNKLRHARKQCLTQVCMLVFFSGNHLIKPVTRTGCILI